MAKMKGYGKKMKSSYKSSDMYGSAVPAGKPMAWGWKGGVIAESVSYKDQMKQMSKDKTVFTPPKQY